MRTQIGTIVIFIVLPQIFGYSKYGRSCKDIGCLNNEMCVMAEDPCSYYNREQCGKYPTCKPAGSTSAPSCENFVCPPTQICHLDDGTPKCVPAKSSSTHVSHNENTHAASNPSYPAQNPSYPSQNPSYPAQNPSYPAQKPSYPAQNPSYPAQNPSYPSNNNPSAPSYPGQSAPSYPSQSGSLYPSINTPRPSGYPSQGGGYAGSPPNSGYPGSTSNNRGYPSQGYPSQGYPSQGYPSQGNPSQGYPSQGYSGYPNQGYPNQNYANQRYPQSQQGYNTQYGNQPTAQSNSNPIVDAITGQLKTIGTDLLKNALGFNKQHK